MKKFLYWTPRLLSIFLAAFISIFALDVFSEGYGAGELALALLMHLLPTIAMVLVIVVAWKHEQLGGWLFIALGVVFLFISGFELMGVLFFTLPLVAIGALFLVYYYKYLKKTE